MIQRYWVSKNKRTKVDGKEEPNDSLLAYLEGGQTTISSGRDIFRGRDPKKKRYTQASETCKIVLKFFLVILILAFLIEFWREHQQLVSQQSLQNQLTLIPPRCRKYLKVSHSLIEMEKGNESGASLLSYFNLWLQEREAVSCRRSIEEQEEKRVKFTWPNPVYVILQLLAKCVLIPFTETGESVGNFFHALLHPQDSVVEEILLLGFGIVILVVVLRQCRERRRRAAVFDWRTRCSAPVHMTTA